jgi:hypothetical protein
MVKFWYIWCCFVQAFVTIVLFCIYFASHLICASQAKIKAAKSQNCIINTRGALYVKLIDAIDVRCRRLSRQTPLGMPRLTKMGFRWWYRYVAWENSKTFSHGYLGSGDLQYLAGSTRLAPLNWVFNLNQSSNWTTLGNNICSAKTVRKWDDTWNP